MLTYEVLRAVVGLVVALISIYFYAVLWRKEATKILIRCNSHDKLIKESSIKVERVEPMLRRK